MTVTAYRSVPAQTDDSPFITSIGERTCQHGIAVSQDLLKQWKVQYHDWVYIENIGPKQVTDCMNKRYKNHIDIWVATEQEEHKIYKKYKNKKLKMWKLDFNEY